MTMTEEKNLSIPSTYSQTKFCLQGSRRNPILYQNVYWDKHLFRKNHIALKFHHFRTHAKYGRVEIQYRPTNEQLANIQTKLFPNKAIFTLRYMLFGWKYAPNKYISN